MNNIVKRMVGLSMGGALWTMMLSGCAMLPHSGPSASMMRDADMRYFNVQVIRPQQAELMNEAVKNHESRQLQDSMETLREWGDSGAQANTIEAGDRLSITLWTRPMHLFSGSTTSSPLNKTDLGKFVVNTDGDITLPYVGRVYVRGLTLSALEKKLHNLYAGSGQFIAPYTSVRWTKHGHLQGVLVSGNVRRPGLVPWRPGGLKLAEVIAQADPESSSKKGHSRQLSYPGTFVTVSYRGQQVQVPLSVVWKHHWLVAPGAHVVVTHTAGNTITVLGGGIKNTGSLSFAQPPSLSSVLASAGGLNAQTANDREIFVMRPPRSGSAKAELMVLHWDTASGLLASAELPLRNGDVVYVPTASVVSLQKAVQIFSGFLLPPALLANAIR